MTIPFRGWTIDADTFRTRAKNFFDHNNVNNSDIFFPLTIHGARIHGWELTLRSPRIHNRGQLYLTYSNQLALGFGEHQRRADGFSRPEMASVLLDHDQRNTLHVGGQCDAAVAIAMRLDRCLLRRRVHEWNSPPDPHHHLPAHTTFDLTLGKEFGERFSVAVNGSERCQPPVLLDNSFTFGGTHYLNPREIFVQVRYRFHY